MFSFCTLTLIQCISHFEGKLVPFILRLLLFLNRLLHCQDFVQLSPYIPVLKQRFLLAFAFVLKNLTFLATFHLLQKKLLFFSLQVSSFFCFGYLTPFHKFFLNNLIVNLQIYKLGKNSPENP